MRCPAFFVFPRPHLHSFRVILDFAILLVELQSTIEFPGDIGELHHGNGLIAFGDGRVELLTGADCRDEIREVSIRWAVAVVLVIERGRIVKLENTRPVSLEVKGLIAIAAISINQYGASGSHNDQPRITIEILHSVAG